MIHAHTTKSEWWVQFSPLKMTRIWDSGSPSHGTGPVTEREEGSKLEPRLLHLKPEQVVGEQWEGHGLSVHTRLPRWFAIRKMAIKMSGVLLRGFKGETGPTQVLCITTQPPSPLSRPHLLCSQ